AQRPEIELEGDIDQDDVETHESDHRPGAEQVEQKPGAEAHGAHRTHQHHETLGPERPVRREHGAEARLTLWSWRGLCHSRRANPRSVGDKASWRFNRNVGGLKGTMTLPYPRASRTPLTIKKFFSPPTHTQ